MKTFLLFSVFIMGTFINDFDILGIPVFYFLWLTLIFLRMSACPVRPVEVLVQCLTMFLVAPAMLVEVFNFQSYWNYYFFIVLYVNFVFMLPYFLEEKRREVFYISLFFLILLSVISLFYIVAGERRAVIGFGPNVLYRIHGMIYAFFILSAIYSGVRSRSVFLIATLLFLVNIVATGSRGGVLVVAVMAIFPLFFGIVKGLRMRLLPVYLAAFFAIIFFLDKIIVRFWRLFKFDADGESAGVRVSYFSSGLDFFENTASWSERVIGISSVNNLWDNYPHNFILEALIYSGLWFFSFFVISFLFLCFSLAKGGNRIGFFVFSGSFVGAMFSGGLMNNFVVFSFLFSTMFLAALEGKTIVFRRRG